MCMNIPVSLHVYTCISYIRTRYCAYVRIFAQLISPCPDIYVCVCILPCWQILEYLIKEVKLLWKGAHSLKQPAFDPKQRPPGARVVNVDASVSLFEKKAETEAERVEQAGADLTGLLVQVCVCVCVCHYLACVYV